MADFASSLPVRTESAGDIIAKIADATVPSQQLAVESDGSINVNFTSTAKIKIWDGTDELAIDASGNIGVTDAGGSLTVDAVNLDIRDLSNATDSVTAHQGGSWTVTATATDLDIRDLTHTSDSVKIGDGSDFLAVNADGSINVKIADSSPGTEVTDYDTTASVAANATDTHTYTSTGNFYLQQFMATGSGKLKIVVKVNAVTKYVMFNSTANPNMEMSLSQHPLATSGQTVTIERTNLQNQPQDVYSTIIGYLA